MLAATVDQGAVVVTQRHQPEPGNGQILVAIHGAGVNAADLLQIKGRYPAPAGVPEDILGLEIAGDVVALGTGVERWGLGDRVMAVIGGGGHAEYAVVHERLAMAVPERLSWEQAGGFSEAYSTAHDALFTQCGLSLGDRLCVHGGAGGVGMAAIQLGIAAGAKVTATVRRSEHRPAVAALGATVVPPEETVAAGPFDVILELIGGPNLPADIDALAPSGRIAVIGIGAGARADINLRALMSKRGRIHGSTLRARSFEERALVARQVEAHVLPLLAAGAVKVPIYGTYPLRDAATAYADFAAGGKLGKLVLCPT